MPAPDERERLTELSRWIAAGGNPSRYERTMTSPSDVDPFAVAASVGARLLHPRDGAFPARIRERVDNPFPWFVRGTLVEGPVLAVVGTRDVDHEGERICRDLVRGLARAGVAVVSGGARGVDTIAHETALGAGGRTLAILPSAFDEPTPRRNRSLFERIVVAGGGLCTEYPPGVRAHRAHFQRRNRLIAAYSDAVLVVRARAHGGTMLTARAAQELRIALLAVPGSPEDRTADGCNLLLKSGARCVTEVADVLEALGIRADPQDPLPPPAHLPVSAPARDVLRQLSGTARTVDDVARATTMSIAQVLAALTELELWGLVERTPSGWRSDGRTD